MRQLIFILTFFNTLNCICQSSEIIESYSDTIKLINGKFYIVDLIKVKSQVHDGDQVRITFKIYLENGNIITEYYEIDKDPVTGCEPKFYDYNGDGFMDYSFVSNMAARGANEIRTLFIFDPKVNRYLHINNSDQYPNLIFNPRLKCLDSWAFHGGTTQSFLRLESDSLSVMYTIDVHGTERVLGKYINGEQVSKNLESIEDIDFPSALNLNFVSIRFS